MGFKAVLSSNISSLSPSEQRIVHTLLGANMSEATASVVAAESGTHESTVVRLAKKLGYRGYRDLRNDLRADEQPSSPRPRVMRGTSGHHLAEFIRDETSALSSLSDFVSQSEIDAAAAAIHRSGEIYLFARENDQPTRDLLARRLRRLGFVVTSLGTSPTDIAEGLASFNERSAIIAFAMREEPPQLATLLAESARIGGCSIVMTDVPGHRFHPEPTHHLAAFRGNDSEYRTQLVPIALCYALQLAVFHLDVEHYQSVRDTIDRRIRSLGGARDIPLQP